MPTIGSTAKTREPIEGAGTGAYGFLKGQRSGADRAKGGAKAQQIAPSGLIGDTPKTRLAGMLNELSEDELQDAKRVIKAMLAGDYETLYQCWREALDGYGSIPDGLLGNEYAIRHFAEKTE